MTAPHRSIDFQALQALEERLATRVAMRLSAGLAQQAEQLPHDVSERLRVARDQAVARARELRLSVRAAGAASPATVGVAGGGPAALLAGGGAPWWQRAASLLPLVMLVLGLLLIERQTEMEQVHAAAEVDTQLLADDLPLDAYSDPGFAEFLRRPAP